MAVVLLLTACAEDQVVAQPKASLIPVIATPSKQIASPTATEAPATATATPQPTNTPTTIPTATPIALPTSLQTAVPTPLPIDSIDTTNYVDRATLRAQIKFSQTRLRDLVFLLNQADQFGELDCPVFGYNYETLQSGSDFFAAKEQLRIANDFYRRAVVQGLFALEPIYLLCEDARGDDIDSAEMPPNLLLDSKSQGAVIMADINDALLWVNGDNIIARKIYNDVQIDIANYAFELSEGMAANCQAIDDLYSTIITSPQFSPPIGYRLDAYINYLDALTFIEQGSVQIDLLCNEQLLRGASEDSAELPLQPDALRTAKWTTLRAQTAIELALDLLPPSEPPPPLVPVYAEVVRTNPLDADNFEIILRVYMRVGTPPYSATADGFPMQSNGRITVRHSCSSDFHSTILVTDATGAQFESEPIIVSRDESCN